MVMINMERKITSLGVKKTCKFLLKIFTRNFDIYLLLKSISFSGPLWDLSKNCQRSSPLSAYSSESLLNMTRKMNFIYLAMYFLSRTQLQWTLAPRFSQILWESSTSVTQFCMFSMAADTGKCPMLIVEEFGHSRGRIFISDFKHLLSELVNQTPVIIKDEEQWGLGWKTCHLKEEV